MSRLLEDIARAQKARKKAEQEAAAQQSIPSVKADASASVAPVANDPPPGPARQPTDNGSSVERFVELEQSATHRMERDAEALEQLKRREEEIARVAEASKSLLEVESRQLEQAQALEAEHAKATLAAEAAAQLEEQARLVAEERLETQLRATDAAQKLKQVEERRAHATRARLEAEKALAVAEVDHVVVEQSVDDIQKQQKDENAALDNLRAIRYRRLVANIVRGTSMGLVLIAFASGVGITALVGVWRSPSPAVATQPAAKAAKATPLDRPILKMDRDLDAFAARAGNASQQLKKQ